MGFNIGTVLGENFGKMFKDIVGAFKIDPEKKAEFQAALDANASIVVQKGMELQGKVQDAVSQEVQSATAIIQAEAGSQSWLPRNVRPLLLLLWGLTITVNASLPLIARLFGLAIEPVQLDPWVYKLTAIGFTGYVTFRSLEKILDSDN